MFGPPNVQKLAAKRDVEGLIKALGYEKDSDVRREAVEALGLIGDARAVEPLIARLGDEDSSVRYRAVEALGLIGDARAVEPLIAKLGDESSVVRRGSAEALEKCGWKPTADGDGAAYWIALDRFDECLRLGAVAMEALIARLGEGDLGVRRSVAEALAKCGWEPSADRDGVTYWIAFQRF